MLHRGTESKDTEYCHHGVLVLLTDISHAKNYTVLP